VRGNKVDGVSYIEYLCTQIRDGNIVWIETSLLPLKDNYLVLNMAAFSCIISS
jgi:hypothetical protein